jgi:hypothetical protein
MIAVERSRRQHGVEWVDQQVILFTGYTKTADACGQWTMRLAVNCQYAQAEAKTRSV